MWLSQSTPPWRICVFLFVLLVVGLKFLLEKQAWMNKWTNEQTIEWMNDTQFFIFQLSATIFGDRMGSLGVQVETLTLVEECFFVFLTHTDVRVRQDIAELIVIKVGR